MNKQTNAQKTRRIIYKKNNTPSIETETKYYQATRIDFQQCRRDIFSLFSNLLIVINIPLIGHTKNTFRETHFTPATGDCPSTDRSVRSLRCLTNVEAFVSVVNQFAIN